MSSDDFTKKKLWGGRFTGTTDPIMHAFNESLSYDKRMWAQDIRGSQAYAKALIACGVLSESEAHTIIQGLSSVAEEWKNGSFRIADDDEDIHTANERRLKELIGPVAGKLHTGRSRNDQVATDMRMWLLDEVDAIVTLITDLLRVMVKRASPRSTTSCPVTRICSALSRFDGLTGFSRMRPTSPTTLTVCA